MNDRSPAQSLGATRSVPRGGWADVGKVIFWLVVFFVVLFALRLDQRLQEPLAQSGQRPGRAPDAGTMTRCVECGVYLPQPMRRKGREDLCAAMSSAWSEPAVRGASSTAPRMVAPARAGGSCGIDTRSAAVACAAAA